MSEEIRPAKFRLFVMMVLQFFIWGAWLPLIFGYLPSLGFSPDNPPAAIAPYVPSFLKVLFSEQALILNMFPLAAIIGMFFSNQFADRNFAAERFLAFSHLVGGLAMLGLGYTKNFGPFLGLMFIHCLLYVPTISITNSIALANMKDAQKEFGIVRMGGTIGWIMAAWPFTFILVDWEKVKAAHPEGIVAWLGAILGNGLTGQALKDATHWTFIVAGIASLALAFYSLSLPHTPAKKKEEGARESLAWLEAMKLLKHPFILILFLVTFVDAYVHNSYFVWTGNFLGTDVSKGGVGIPGNWIMPVMSVGQIAEILTMAVLGMTLKRLGWKWTMVVGVLGYAVRFAVYSFLPQYAWLIILVQIAHGICYAFFFATVYIFVDAYFPKDARASAQGLFNVMILGVGSLVANSISPYLSQKVFVNADGTTNFHTLFLLPCLLALGNAIALALFFNPPPQADASAVATGH
ncbi:MAG TPA: MFS transporter [Planctomycetota bacterium]|nr:MFS transporter [Planctomycetota bacterium]